MVYLFSILTYIYEIVYDAEITSQNDRPEGKPSTAAKDLAMVNEERKKDGSPV